MEEYSKTILEEMNISSAFAEWSIDLVKYFFMIDFNFFKCIDIKRGKNFAMKK